MVFTIEVFKDKQEYIAKCNELNIYTYGKNDTDAVERLKKVFNFYIKSAEEYINEETGNVNTDGLPLKSKIFIN